MLKCNFPECREAYDTPALLVRHMSRRHELSEFNCVLCGQMFTSSFTFKRHLIVEFSRKLHESNNNQLMLEVLPFNECEFELWGLEQFEPQHNMTVEQVDNSPKFNEEEHLLAFSTNVFNVILDLYGNMGTTKKMATDISKHIQKMICLPILKNLLPQLKCQEDKSVLENYIEDVNGVLEKMNTEYKFKELLKKKNLYFEARQFDIVNDTDVSKGYLFPLVNNLKALFNSKPDLLLGMLLKYEEITTDYHEDLITNLVTQEVWRNKVKHFQGKTVLPILLYQDDIEINNPLGSKALKQKISTVYITLPLLDSFHVSKLAYQIPASLTMSTDFSAGLYANYYHLSQILKDIEENGIEFNLYGTTVTVHFVVATVVGDNLAQNMVLGYVMSFNVDYFCRFCVAKKRVTEKQVLEDKSLLRWNVDNTVRYLGIVRDSPLDKEIESMDVIDCVSVDVVHDFLEGIVKLEMSNIICKFLEKRYFDLTTLNNAMLNFDKLSRFEKKNKCSYIRKGHLNKNILKMSASEICLFMKYFAMYIKEHVPGNIYYV